MYTIRFLVTLPIMLGLLLLGCRTESVPGNVLRSSTSAVAPPRTPGGVASQMPNKLTSAEALLLVKAERDAYFINAQREVYKGVREILGQHQDELEHGMRFAKLVHGNRQRKQIALTFDDGPHPTFTPQLLAILRQENVKATFFVVGRQAERYPELVRAEAAAGHIIANHTYHHVSLPKIPPVYVADEIKACGLVLRNITGQAPRFFRPPGGEYNTAVAETAEALGYIMVLWTDDPGDYASPGETIILERTLDKASPGGIILLHDGIQQTLTVLPQLIRTLKARGYEFVTVEQMATTLRPGAVVLSPRISTRDQERSRSNTRSPERGVSENRPFIGSYQRSR